MNRRGAEKAEIREERGGERKRIATKVFSTFYNWEKVVINQKMVNCYSNLNIG